MPLAASARALLDQLNAAGLPPPGALPVLEARRMAHALMTSAPGPAVEVARVEDHRLDAAAGTLALRVYTPPEEGPLPLVVFCHGGGFVFGDLDTHDRLCRELCLHTGSVVVAVDYRLAPEHPFPAALDDTLSALRWARAHAVAWGADAGRLIVAGDSAGGNLAAMACLRFRDGGDPPPAGQLLLYPVCGHYDPPSPSYLEFAEGHFLTRAAMRWFIDHYVGTRHDGAFPLQAPALHGLPAAFVLTAECDPLRDEGRAYAERLRDAGVPTQCLQAEGMIHGFMSQSGLHPQAGQAWQAIAAWVRSLAA